MKKVVLIILSLCFLGNTPLFSQKMEEESRFPDYSLRGLTLSLQAGMAKANNYSAEFYNGHFEHDNNINRIIHSELYGQDVWSYLVEQNVIVASTRPEEIEIAEYGKMRYDLTVSIGLGFQYNFSHRTGFFMQFSHESYDIRGSFLIKKTTPIASFDNYYRCGIFGNEKRNGIDLGYIYRIPMTLKTKLTLEGGVNITDIKVVENQVKIGDMPPISILNIWGSMGPIIGTDPYEYYNNGISYGFFLTPVYSFNLWQDYAVDVGCSFRFLKTNLEGYEKFSMQNVLFIRFLINRFTL